MTNEPSGELRVLLLQDPHDADAMRSALEQMHPRWVIRQVDSEPVYVSTLDSFAPDVILVGTSTGFNLIEALRQAQRQRPGSPFILVSAECDPVMVEALKAGAADFVSRSDLNRLDQSIKRALEARAPLRRLSNRQLEVLQLLSSGSSTRVIAERLNLSVKTVETHRAQVMKRVGIRDLAGLVRFSVYVGLVSATA